MKTCILLLIAASALSASAAESIRLKLEPEQKILVAGPSQDVVLKIDLTATATKPKTRRPPLNLSLVLDRSGSMTGAKIEQARQAASQLVDQLAEDDIFSLVIYSSGVQVLVPAQRVEDRESLKRTISRIRTDGGTALYAGVEAGAAELRRHFSRDRVNRIILLSDGLANIGPSSPADLKRLGSRLSAAGISVTTMGLGADYNEDLMAGLAEASDANYYFVQDTEKLPAIFAKELGSLLTIAAREIKIEITCPEGVHPLGLIGRPEVFQDRRAVVRLDNLASGQNRYLLLRCQTQQNTPLSNRQIATVRVTYENVAEPDHALSCAESATVSYTEDQKRAVASANQTIVTQREWVLNAVRKDEAIADADAGRLNEAAIKLTSQANALAAQCVAAPIEFKRQLNDEIQNLRSQAKEFNQGQYTSGARKSLQHESWSVKNSK